MTEVVQYAVITSEFRLNSLYDVVLQCIINPICLYPLVVINISCPRIGYPLGDEYASLRIWLDEDLHRFQTLAVHTFGSISPLRLAAQTILRAYLYHKEQ